MVRQGKKLNLYTEIMQHQEPIIFSDDFMHQHIGRPIFVAG
jgi:hypothetical protein